MPLESIDPATGKTLQTYDEMSPSEVGTVLESVDADQREWSQTSFEHRAGLLEKVGESLRGKSDGLAKLMAQEMGKPLAGGVSEVEKCAWVCDYYADHAAEFLADETIESDASKSYVAFRPLGVVLAVMPWNFPLWQVYRFAAPALMAGNGAVLKHASNVPGSAFAMEEIFREAGLPEHIFRTLPVQANQVEAIIRNPIIKAVTLTGSTRAGKAVAEQAGSVLKKCVLELGGSDAYVILEDADLEATAKTCVTSRLINSGQSCIAAKRFIVVESVREKFEELVVEHMKDHKMGNPQDEGVTVGPQARVDLRDELHDQTQKSIAKGARCLLGGEVPDGPGAFYPPTVLAGVEPGMPAYDEELFGPVVAIIAADNEDDAIRIANDSVFGLGAAVFTQDRKRGEEIARDRIEAGSCFVNAFVKSDPRLPFGGIKESGFGRELSHYGIKEFVNIKTVYLA